MRRSKFKLSKKQKEQLKIAGKWTGLGLFVYETFMLMVHQRQHKRDVFNLALQQQAATHKKLLVVGNPSGDVISKILGADYDCADLCIDPGGCEKCANSLQMPVRQALATLGNGSYVVYVAPGILEHDDDITLLLNELQRVSGGDLFVSHVYPYTLRSVFAKRRVFSAPPDSNYTEWRDLPWMPGKSTVERLDGVRGVGDAVDTSKLLPTALVLGAGGAFLGYQFGNKKALPAIAGAAAGTAAAAAVVMRKRDEALGA